MSRRNGELVLIAMAVGAVLRSGGTAVAQDAEPSWRVGRLAALSGGVASHGPGRTDWLAAVANTPLQPGDAIWVPAGGSAEIQVQQDDLVLDEATELDLAALDGRVLGFVEPQGRSFLDLYDVPAGQQVTVTTPRGAVRLVTPGRYEVVAGTSTDPTRIAVVAGSATISSGSFALTVNANQMASITGDAALDGRVDALAADPFLVAQLRRLRVRAPGTPAAVCGMTGGAALGGYGRWDTRPEAGAVWFPQVAADWVPYREGRWSWVAPWGWTWVDDEPWGFAPFHYGRWAQFDGRWGWIPFEADAPPVAIAEPAYAPALVAFLAAGAVAGVAAGGLPGAGGGPVGWVPLGPHEPYRPPFAAGQPYLQRLSFAGIDRDDRHAAFTTIEAYRNRGAFSAMPAAAMARSEPVPRATPVAAERDGQFRPVGPGAGLPPPPRTANNRRFDGPAAGGSFDRPAAGPVVNPALFHPRELPNDRTPFRAAGVPNQSTPPGRPGGGPVHAIIVPDGAAGHGGTPARGGPIHGGPAALPQLRAPGSVPDGAPPGAHPGPGPAPGAAERSAPGTGPGGAGFRAVPGAGPGPGSGFAEREPNRTTDAPAPGRRPAAEHAAPPARADRHPEQRPEQHLGQHPGQRPEFAPERQREQRPELRGAPPNPGRSEPPRPQFARPAFNTGGRAPAAPRPEAPRGGGGGGEHRPPH